MNEWDRRKLIKNYILEHPLTNPGSILSAVQKRLNKEISRGCIYNDLKILRLTDHSLNKLTDIHGETHYIYKEDI